MRNWELRVDELPDPTPGPGQVLAKVLACGICGSDLHLLQHGAEQLTLQAELETDQPPDAMRMQPFVPDHDVVMGHEFCCEVVDLGPGVSNLSVGDRVVSMPVTFDTDGLHGIGFSNRYNGGYAELMVLNELMCIKVPGDLPDDLAALTEPLAVGVHAVAMSRIGQHDAAIVLGLGPVGLATIAELKMRGIGPVVGADFSPRRRGLAEHLGADVVVDPRETSAIEAWRGVDGKRSLVIFEAVGVPGMLDQAMRAAPRGTQILVVGVCMQLDQIRPMIGITKELNLQFALGYQPLEFGAALTALAEQRVDLAPMITGIVNLDGVPQAFQDLANPEAHAKLLVRP
jgi:threonine dehydrogenase-like Zn-dependent dehydrogenase